MARDEYLLRISVAIKNDKALGELTRELERAAKSAPKTQKAIEGATKNTRRFGNAAQNAGYQIQDLAIQIQGGVDPLRAFSQQSGQMLVGFGAWGAAIGVVTALMPALISYLKGAEEAAVPLVDAMSDLDSAISEIPATFNDIDFDSWNEQWNKSSQAVRGTQLELLKLRTLIAQGELKDAIRSLSKEAEEGAGGLSFWQESLAKVVSFVDGSGFDAWAKNLQSINLNEAFGIDRADADRLIAMLEELQAGSITLEQFSAQITEMGLSSNAATKEFINLIIQTKQLEQAQKDLLVTTEQINTAESSGGADLATRAKARAEAAEQEAAAKQELARVEASLSAAIPAGNNDKTIEQFSYMEEAVSLFDQSFNTMLDGVLLGTRDMSDAFEDMAKNIIAQLLKLAAYRSIANLFGTETIIGAAAQSLLPNAKGNAFVNGNVQAFAKGGVVSSPTIFPMAKGAGLMGESGPEGILPLARTANGDLGVKSTGMSVVINNMAAGVDVTPRQTDEGLTVDIVTRTLANSIRQGGNPLTDALEGSYSLGRGGSVY